MVAPCAACSAPCLHMPHESCISPKWWVPAQHGAVDRVPPCPGWEGGVDQNRGACLEVSVEGTGLWFVEACLGAVCGCGGGAGGSSGGGVWKRVCG